MFIWSWHRSVVPGIKTAWSRHCTHVTRLIVTCFAFKIVQPSTTTLTPDVLWSSSLQHMMRSGGESDTSELSRHTSHVVTWLWRMSERFFRAESPLPYWGGGGVMWSWYAPERHPALKLWHAVTSLTCWLLGCWKRLAHVWNCWHSLTLTQGKDEKNFIPIRVDCGFLTSMVSVQMGRLIM